MSPSSYVIPTTLIAVAALCWALQTIFSILSGKNLNQTVSATIFSIPCICLLVAACTGWHSTYYFEPPPAIFSFGNMAWKEKLDTLACAYIGLLGFSGLAVSFFSPGYLSHLRERLHLGQYWAALSLFMLSMMLVILSANAIIFLVFWEIMSLSSLALVASEHKEHRVQHASIIYLGATRIATGFLSIGFLCLFSHFHSWEFSAWHLAGNQQLVLPSLLILIGFCIKAGIWPFHIWLPYAHPAAPSPVSALMSGVMIKIAIYAIIRVLVANGSSSIIIAYTAFGLGLVSAFWGVLFAIVQHDLKRLLAFSSVENVGLMLLGIGVALLARSSEHPLVDPLIGSVALAATIFHSLNHGLFKSLLFLGAGCLDSSVHTYDLKNLGGLATRMPWTTACFMLASAAICALPPLNGFAGKWLLYQSLFRTTWQTALSPVDRAIALASLGVLGLVGGLALACFSKAFGIAFLGKARSSAVDNLAHEVSRGMIQAQVMLASACVALGLFAGLITRELMALSTDLLGTRTLSLSENLFPIPLPTLSMWVLGIIFVIHLCFLSPKRVRRYITWECGFGETPARAQATGVSFAQPLAQIFDPVLRSKLKIEILGSNRRHFPESIKVEPQLGTPLEDLIYKPCIDFIQRLAKAFNKLQTGSIHLYLLYVCVTLVILLLIGIRL